MVANEIFRFFQKHVFPFSGVFRGFCEKLIAGIDYPGIFLYKHSFRIYFQAYVYDFYRWLEFIGKGPVSERLF